MVIDNLPTWKQCDDKWSNLKTLTALERFIFDWQPSDDTEEFRAALAAVVEEAKGGQS